MSRFDAQIDGGKWKKFTNLWVIANFGFIKKNDYTSDLLGTAFVKESCCDEDSSTSDFPLCIIYGSRLRKG